MTEVETRVGYMTTSILEEMTKDLIIKNYRTGNYGTMLEMIEKYSQLKEYNR